MRVLVIKLTSMGDVLHVLPALSDLHHNYKGVIVDLLVEDSFREIPAWHDVVQRVISVSTRRWRSVNKRNITEVLAARRLLCEEKYDVIIDAQGLMKSAFIGLFAKLKPQGYRVGFCGDSIKESPAAWLYKKCVTVDRQQHAIDRLRQLFANVFDYKLPDAAPDYGLKSLVEASNKDSSDLLAQKPYIVLLHGTTWASKHLPKSMWRDLAELICKEGYQVLLPWGNEDEKVRAQWIAEKNKNSHVLGKMNLNELSQVLVNAKGAIAVDTGLGHLAAALSVPCVSIYGSTDAILTGAIGEKQTHLQTDYTCSPCLQKQCAKINVQEALNDRGQSEYNEIPCYQTLSVIQIWQSLRHIIG